MNQLKLDHHGKPVSIVWQPFPPIVGLLSGIAHPRYSAVQRFRVFHGGLASIDSRFQPYIKKCSKKFIHRNVKISRDYFFQF